MRLLGSILNEEEASAEEIEAMVQARRALNTLKAEERFERMAPWDLDMKLGSSRIAKLQMDIVVTDLKGQHAISKARLSNIEASAARTARRR